MPAIFIVMVSDTPAAMLASKREFSIVLWRPAARISTTRLWMLVWKPDSLRVIWSRLVSSSSFSSEKICPAWCQISILSPGRNNRRYSRASLSAVIAARSVRLSLLRRNIVSRLSPELTLRLKFVPTLLCGAISTTLSNSDCSGNAIGC